MGVISNIVSKITGSAAGGLVKDIGEVADKFITTEAERGEFELKLKALVADHAKTQAALLQSAMDAQGKAVVAEIQGSSWMQRNWRPLIMLLFGFIVAFNFVFVPLFGAWFGVVSLPIPAPMWDLLQIGIGGYIGGRSLEKVAETVAPAMHAISEKRREK